MIKFRFKYLGKVFSGTAGNEEEKNETLSRAQAALMTCYRLAVDEFYSIIKARLKSPYLEKLLTDLEGSGDYNPSFEYIFLRNIRRVCDELNLEYVGEVGEVGI